MSPIRVVLVDDHPVVRDGLAAVLATAPDLTVVAAAADARTALALIETSRPDVVVTDLRMTGGSGLELIAELRGRSPDLPVLVLSTFAEPAEVLAVLDAGATGYVLKDTDGPALVAAVRDTARGRPVLSPAVAAELAASRRTGANGASPREREILHLVADGRTNEQIARRLRVSQATVKTHLTRLFAKLAAVDRASAVVAAARRGWIDLDRSPET